MIGKFNKILFATDLSNNCQNAFSYAASLAVMYNSRITILHVMETLSESMDERLKSLLGKDDWELMQKEQENSARAAIIGKKSVLTSIRAAIEVIAKPPEDGNNQYTIENILIKEGNVVDNILKASVDENCDLVIIGSNKTMFTDNTSLGNHMKGVLKRSKVPVLMIPPIE